jgi:5,10-methenyltetrahydrofolate synthetase
VHVRNPEGRESLAPEDVGRILLAVRAACPGTPVGISTGIWIVASPAERAELAAAWDVLPDFASVNFHEPGAVDLARLLLSRGIGIEAGVFHGEAVLELARSGLLPSSLRVLLEPQEQNFSDALSRVSEIEAALDSAGAPCPRLLHGVEATAWPLLRKAARRGYQTRIGFEDTLVMPDGSSPQGNADLIRAARRLLARKQSLSSDPAPGSEGPVATKSGLRQDFLSRRRAMDAAARTALSERIAARLFELEPYRGARLVHLYVGAVDGEVETRTIALDALQQGKRVACPRVEKSPARLEHYEIRSLAELVEGGRGLWEPNPARARPVPLEAVDVVLVPGIAFDRHGHRIGFGAGYYDRFLAGVSAPKIGLAYSLQIAQRIPYSPRDVPVDWIVTEAETIPCRANREGAEGEAEASEARH